MTFSIKEIIKDKWIVNNNLGNYIGLLIKNNNNHHYYFYEQTDNDTKKYQFENHTKLCDHFGEDITQNQINKIDENKCKTSTIKGYPLNFNNPIIVKHDTLPTFKKAANSSTIYCAGFYMVKNKEGWKKWFCPKKITLDGAADWQGPFANESDIAKSFN